MIRIYHGKWVSFGRQLEYMDTITRKPSIAKVSKVFLFAGYLFGIICVFPLSAPLSAGAFDSLRNSAAEANFTGVPEVSRPVEPSVANSTAALSFPRPLHVYFLNVGQGDAIYIELPNGDNALIDAGPSQAKDSYLSSFLAAHEVKKIDNMVLTHPHSDHYTGFRYVLSKYPVTNFYDTQVNNTATTVDETIRAKALSLGVNIVYPEAGDNLAWDPGEVQVKVLHSCPGPVASGGGQMINNCSIVLKLAYQNVSMLFTGDMQQDVEAALVEEYGPELKADVLKVGHHGSQYSSSEVFLAAVHPGDAYISVGANNTYGHPTPSCLARLQASGAVIHRTDMDGTFEYTVAGPSSAASYTGDGSPSLRY
jgi:beta-lactamase superfamily II metal-dependent hydrolase